MGSVGGAEACGHQIVTMHKRGCTSEQRRDVSVKYSQAAGPARDLFPSHL